MMNIINAVEVSQPLLFMLLKENEVDKVLEQLQFQSDDATIDWMIAKGISTNACHDDPQFPINVCLVYRAFLIAMLIILRITQEYTSNPEKKKFRASGF